MIFKSYILENNLKSFSGYKSFLFYGENHGLKKEFKEKLKVFYKDAEILNLFQEEIIKNKNILLNEIQNKSLFNKEKIIFINQANDKILSILEEINENIESEKIFIFSEILDKKSKLRNFFEKSKENGITACYQDNEITIKKIITTKLRVLQGLSPQIINLIIKSTGLDRDKVNNEIEKILSCFSDKKIDADKIEQLLNIRVNDEFDLLKDQALIGNKINTNKLLADTFFATENNIYYINAINQKLSRLNEIANLKNENSNIEMIINELRPPVFWKDKPKLVDQAKKWNKQKLQQAKEKTYNAEIEIKSNSSIRKDLIIKNLIVDLCSVANAS